MASGVGAINLPLMSGMVGSRTTKSCHPQFLRLMSRLASVITENDFEFRLPFFDQTKGEVVKTLGDLNLQELARMTLLLHRVPPAPFTGETMRSLPGMPVPPPSYARRRHLRIE